MSFFPETIVVTGPTATGKTALAVKLAEYFNGEIVSVDSRQVFRHMDIGSGKDLGEYGNVPYHLLDVVDPGEPYDLFTYLDQAKKALQDIAARGKMPLLCGGSTMYLDALLRGYELSGAAPDMELRNLLDQLSLEELNARLDELAPPDLDSFKDRDNALRVRRAIENTLATGKACCVGNDETLLKNSLVLGVYFPRQEVHQRVENRLDSRLAEGMIDEVKNLHEVYGVSWEVLERYGLEYRYVSLYLQGKLDYKSMRDQLLYSIRKFVKRQDIWFRKMERENIDIHWVMRGNFDEARSLVEKFLAHEPLPDSPVKLSETFYGNKINK
jgi:tRNA dimethylallyltransferase